MKRAAPLTQDAIQERGAELRRAEGAGDLAGAYRILKGLSDADFGAVALEAGHSLVFGHPAKRQAHVQAQVAACCRSRRDGFLHRKTLAEGRVD